MTHGDGAITPAPSSRPRADVNATPEAPAASATRPTEPDTPVADAPPCGLTSAEVRRRLAEYGPNAVPEAAAHPLRRALGKLWAPVPWMLEASIVLELALGKYVEAAIIAALLIFNGAIGYFQEGRAHATLAALRSRLALNASVLRDGTWRIVPAAELVPGDVVKISLGAVVAADVRLIDGTVLIDQSMLTGESVPVEREPGARAYAGALVRRGEATAEVTQTGARTKFGRTAELVRSAHVASSQEKAVLRVVRNLATFNGALIIGLIAYAMFISMPMVEIVPLVLTAVLASIPVALPATFTLAAAVAAQSLAKVGVLPTRLSAVDEAATMDVLCADKTGTLTNNELQVTSVRAMSGFDEARVLELAALASSEGGQDPVDGAIRAAALRHGTTRLPRRIDFLPFDPATKMAEAKVSDSSGETIRVVKGAFAAVAGVTSVSPIVSEAAYALEGQGYRVLAVAAGPPAAMGLAGLIALGDPPRAGEFAVFAGVLPEDKFRLVQALQSGGHIVGMCGDGANDAPALRQAHMGIAVSTATDVAKSAAGMVLTRPGLSGIVAAVREGRVTFQRILTYTLNSVIKKMVTVLFLAAGLLMTGQGILTPMLMALVMVTGDFLTMSLTTDRVHPSAQPNVWRIGNVTLAGAIIGVMLLIFCVGVLGVGHFRMHLGPAALDTLALLALVFGSQATLYAVRDRQRPFSRTSRWVDLSATANVLAISTLATLGVLMAPLPLRVVAGTLAGAVAFGLGLAVAKLPLFRRLRIA